jgi:hypothetical protein
MNCQEVQLQLSGYLEKALDAVRMKGIETHLSSCPFCRAELHGLSDCIRQVASLPMVEPPVGFTERIMAHAREIELEPSGWQRLLMALKSTVPIQAAAMVLIGILAVFIYQKDPTDKTVAFNETNTQIASATALQLEEKNAPRAVEPAQFAAEPSREREPNREPPAPVAVARQATPQVPAEKAADGSEATRDDAAAVPQSAALGKSETLEKPSEGRLQPRRATIQAQEVSTGSESRRSNAEPLDIGAAIGALSRTPFRGTPYSAGRVQSPLSEPAPDFEFVVRRRPRERAEHKDNVSEVSLKAEVPAAREPMSPPSNSMVEIRWFTVKPEHYEYFRKDLAAEANIESEKTTGPRAKETALQSPQELLIKVLILQP